MTETAPPSQKPSPPVNRLGMFFQRFRHRWFFVLLWIAIAWMGIDVVSTWVIYHWLPTVAPIQKIEKDIQKELARATQLEPVWDHWRIKPTLFEGLCITVEGLQLRKNPKLIEEMGVSIPTPKTFKPISEYPEAVKKTALASELPSIDPTLRQAMVSDRTFKLYIRYWPLITKQHMQISRIQLEGVRLLGGPKGILTHYIPVLYDAEYGRKYFKKKDPPSYLYNATVRFDDVALSQSVSQGVLTVPDGDKKHHGKRVKLAKTLPLDRIGLYLDTLEVRHLVAKQPLGLTLKGAMGVFETEHKSKGRQRLNQRYSRWNRTFDIDAESRITGDNYEKAFEGPWGYGDLKKLKVRIAPQAHDFLDNPENEAVTLVMVQGEDKSGKMAPFHRWAFDMYHFDLSLIEDATHAMSTLFGYSLPGDTAHYLDQLYIQGGLKADVDGRLLWPEKLQNPPRVVVDSGALQAQHISVGYRDALQQQVPFLDRLHGRIQVRNDVWAFPKIQLNVGDSPLQVSGTWQPSHETLDARVKTHRLSIPTLVDSLAQLADAVEEYDPALLPPDARTALVQWQSGQIALAGLIDIDMGVKGPVSKLDYAGTAELNEGRFVEPESKIEVSKLHARVSIRDKIKLDDLSANVMNASIRATGEADKEFERAHADVKAGNIDLAECWRLAQEKLTAEQKKALAAIAKLSGKADIALAYDYAKAQNSHHLNGDVTVDKLSLTPSLDGKSPNPHPIEFNRLVFHFNRNQMTMPATKGHWGPIPLNLTAQANWPGQMSTNAPVKFTGALDTGTLPASMFRDQSKFFASLLPNNVTYPNIWNTEGALSLQANVTEKELDSKLALHNVGASWEGGDLPLYGVNGEVTLKQAFTPNAKPVITTNQLQGRYGNSPITANAISTPTGPKLTVRGRISPLTLNHYLTASQAVYAGYDLVPFRLELAQRPTPNLPPEVYAGRLFLGLNRLLINPPKESPDTVIAMPDGQPPKDRPQYRSFVLAEFGLNLNAVKTAQYPAVQLYPSRLHLSDFGDIWMNGHLAHFPQTADWTKLAGELHVLTSPVIDLKGIGEHFRSDIFQQAKGSLAADLTLASHPEQKETARTVNGWVEMSGIELPQFLIEDITGKIAFEEQKALIDFPSVRFQGANLSLKAQSPQTLKMPVPLEQVSIKGAQLNLPAVQQFNTDIVAGKVSQVTRRFAARRWEEGDAMVPLEFKDAEVDLNEVVYQNILLENFKGHLSLYANSFVQLDNVDLSLAGGKVKGYLEMNPFDNNFVALDIKTQDVKANALTRALLGVSNQIFGDVNGTIRFSTHGATDVEMLNNANGTVKMQVANGRLPALSHVETLLTAANLLRGGILGFNVNNLVRTVIPFRAQYFAELSGDMQIADKKLHTDNLLSDGRNLDLLMQGTVNMDDGQADMTINGTMNQDVSGAFGTLGKLSLGRILRYIPIFGFNPLGAVRVKKDAPKTPGEAGHEVANAPTDDKSLINDPGLLYHIPGLGYVPGLGGPAKNVNRFRIHMKGPPQDPASIQSFGWVRGE